MHEPSRRAPEGPPSIRDHEVVRLIGCGSYGEVWLARSAVGTWRAVKVVYRYRFKEPHPYEREFIGIQKYEPISRTNDALVDVLQIGRNEAEGYFYYVMELADDAIEPGRKFEPGERDAQSVTSASVLSLSQPRTLSPGSYIPRTLSLDLIRRGRLSLEECVTLGMTLNLALGYLHRNSLIHRDVKPPNIIYVNGVPKLADIGLVADSSGANSFVGTEGYVPPEGPNSPQADLYALGKVLYEAGMGRDRMEFPEPLTRMDLEPDAKGLTELHAVVKRACASDPKQRYRSAEEMNADLALLHSGRSVQQKHEVERRLKLTRRVAVGAVALMVLAVFPYCLAILEARAARKSALQAVLSEKKATQAQTAAEQHLYDSLLGEARATRLARRVGYRDNVFSLLQQASALNVPQKDPAELRREAGACLGDFVGLTPATFSDFHPNSLIQRVLFNPDGQSAAFLLRDKTVWLRRLPSGFEISRFPLSGELPTRSICFNDTGDQLVLVRMPGGGELEDRIGRARLNVWSRGDGDQWREVEDTPLPGALDCMSFTGGVYVTVFERNPRLGKLVDVSTKAVVHRFEFPEGPIPEVALSPDGQWLLAETTRPEDRLNSVLEVWDLKTGERRTQLALRLGILVSLGFSPDGKYFACAAEAGGAIYEVPGLRRVAGFSVYARAPHVFTPVGNLVAVPIPQENSIRLWDWMRNDERALLNEAQPAGDVAFAPDGQSLLTACPQYARFYKLDVRSEKINLPRHQCTTPCMTFSPNGQRIASVGKDPGVRVCDAATGRELWRSDKVPMLGHGVDYSSDGQWLATGDDTRHRVFIWNAETGERLLEVPMKAQGRLWSVQFSPDDRYLATASGIDPNENGIGLWAIERREAGRGKGAWKATFVKSTGNSAWNLAFLPDKRSLAFVDRDSAGIWVWDYEGAAAPRRVATDLIRRMGNVQSFGFTPDGQRVLLVDHRRAVVTVDVTSGKVVSSFATLDARRTPEWTQTAGMCLSPDGTRAAMISASGCGVDVWEPVTGRLVCSLPELKGTVYWQAWSPDGQRLAVSQSNGDIAVWNLPEVEKILARLELNR